MRARFTFHPKDGNVQTVTVPDLTVEQAAEIRAAITSDPGAVVRVTCSVTPGAESLGVRVFTAGRIRDFETAD